MKISVRGNLNKTTKFLKSALKGDYLKDLNYYGKKGVIALSNATPKTEGKEFAKTANSWDYEIVRFKDRIELWWTNSNVISEYANVAILLQFGHATRAGRYVKGRDYINPAIEPVFKEMCDNMFLKIIEGI